MTSAYHLKTNGQAKIFSGTIITRQWHYVVESQRDCNVHVQPWCMCITLWCHTLWIWHPVSCYNRCIRLIWRHFIPMALITDARSITSPHVLRARFLHCMATMSDAADKPMKTEQWRYKDKPDKKIRNAPQTLYLWQYVYISCSPMTISAAERLATNAFSKLISPRIGSFRTVKNLAGTVTIDEGGI